MRTYNAFGNVNKIKRITHIEHCVVDSFSEQKYYNYIFEERNDTVNETTKGIAYLNYYRDWLTSLGEVRAKNLLMSIDFYKSKKATINDELQNAEAIDSFNTDKETKKTNRDYFHDTLTLYPNKVTYVKKLSDNTLHYIKSRPHMMRLSRANFVSGIDTTVS